MNLDTGLSKGMINTTVTCAAYDIELVLCLFSTLYIAWYLCEMCNKLQNTIELKQGSRWVAV